MKRPLPAVFALALGAAFLTSLTSAGLAGYGYEPAELLSRRLTSRRALEMRAARPLRSSPEALPMATPSRR